MSDTRTVDGITLPQTCGELPAWDVTDPALTRGAARDHAW